jgi:pilus assembly protein Flp/PilA
MPCPSLVKRILWDESGASAIEYGLAIAMISIGLIAAFQSLAGQLNSTVSTASSSLTTATTSA